MAKPWIRNGESGLPGGARSAGTRAARLPRIAARVAACRATAVVALAMALAATGSPAAAAAPEPLRVVTTVGMIGDVAREVGGACVNVQVLMGPGTDPHLYQPRAGDVRRLQQADLILYAGLSLEGQLGDVLARFGARTPTVAVSEQAVAEEDRITADDAYAVDPHVWMDVSLWARTVPVIQDALARAVPDCAADLHANAQAYLRQLDALHEWVAAAIASIPERQRILVTAHDAFAYFGRAYGIEVAGIQGISTDAEAGIADVRDTAELVATRGVAAVFVESTVNPRTVRAVVEAAAERGHAVRVGPELLADAMGAEGTPRGSYVGMIVHNAQAISEELGGSVPPLPEALGPWSGRWDEGR